MTTGKKGYQPWFEKDPQLFREQTDILTAAGFGLNQVALDKEGRVEFLGYSKADPQRKLCIHFPDAFPSSAPKIFDTTSSKLLSRHHRFDTRQLCLFGFSENRWDATKSVAHALAEVNALIAEFKDTKPPTKEDPPEPLSRAIPYERNAAILVPPPISTFNDFEKIGALNGAFSGEFVYEGQFKREIIGRGIILEANFGNERRRCGRPYSEFLQGHGDKVHGDWFYIKEPPRPDDLPGILEKCVRRCRAFQKTDYHWLGLVFHEETATNNQTRLAWAIGRIHAKEPNRIHFVRTFPYLQEERFVRIPGLEGLEQKRITLIGCGSIGSKIAANLAASGVNRFCLVDCDFYEPNNSVRHELGVESFGLEKERALLNRLTSLNPASFANSALYRFQVGGNYPSSQELQFYDHVKQSDLLIDAAGMHGVSHFLNRLACEMKIPAIFVTVTDGAWGGEIVRVVPGKSACWMCWCDQYYDNKPPSAPKATTEIFAPGCDQPTFTGTTYDLGIVANLATSMAVETLLTAPNSVFSDNYMRWSGRDIDGKPLFSTELLSTMQQQGCCYCGS